MRRGRDADGVLKDAGEAVGRVLGAAAVEAEDEIVEVALQVLGADGTVVRAQEPPLGEAEDEMDGGQALVGLAPRAREVDGVMVVAGGSEPLVTAPAVGGDRGALGDVGRDYVGSTTTTKLDEFENRQAAQIAQHFAGVKSSKIARERGVEPLWSLNCFLSHVVASRRDEAESEAHRALEACGLRVFGDIPDNAIRR